MSFFFLFLGAYCFVTIKGSREKKVYWSISFIDERNTLFVHVQVMKIT